MEKNKIKNGIGEDSLSIHKDIKNTMGSNYIQFQITYSDLK